MIIEKIQKQILFEEASKKSISEMRLRNLREIYEELLPQTDVGKQIYNSPLSPVYIARTEDVINIGRIADFFKGLVRDHRVLSQAVSELEASVAYMNIEFWNRVQRNKAHLTKLVKELEAEKSKISQGGTWSFVETFSSTLNLNMQTTTAWIDTSEGVATLPSLGEERTVSNDKIVVESSTPPENGSFLGSSPYDCLDSLQDTNWRVRFTKPNTLSTLSLIFDKPYPISAINIDLVGFGVRVRVECQIGNSPEWVPVVDSVIFSKDTLPVGLKNVTKVRFYLEPSETSLPKIVGFKNLTFYTSNVGKTASIFSTELLPTYNYNEIKIGYKGKFPDDTSVRIYYANSPTGSWKEATDSWSMVRDSYTTEKTIQSYLLTTYDKWLYSFSIPDQAINLQEGSLDVGVNQVEIKAFRKDWSGQGENPKVLSHKDFEDNPIARTWTSLGNFVVGGNLILQNYNASSLANANIRRGGIPIFQRTQTSFDDADLCIVPFNGDEDNQPLQPAYNYSFQFKVYCSKESFYEDGKYWFLQGHRQAGSRSFREIGKSYGAVSVYVNDVLVIADSQPGTIYSDNTLETTAESGKNFDIKLLEGWNTITIFISCVDYNLFSPDPSDMGDPYLQFNMNPSFFSSKFQQEMNIHKIVGSGSYKPVSEFDLLWNLPESPTFWSWRSDRRAAVFNTTSVRPIDGFLRGVYPTSKLMYKSTNINQEIEPLYLWARISRGDNLNYNPILDEIMVMVK